MAIGLTFDTFHSRAETAAELFESSLEDWKEVVKRFGEEETRSLPPLPNPGLSHLSPGLTTSARFQWLEPLGTGTYGQVSKVREVSTNSIYAQKTIRVQNSHRARNIIEQQVRNEVAIMHKLRHHHIASVLFYVRDETTFSIIMLPVGDYDLRHFLEVNCAGFPRTETRHLDQWFGCLASALAYAHQERVKHEDIKPSNILIRDHQPYLADFGSAIDFSLMEGSTSTEEYIVGTPVYWPPEPLQQRGRAADVFALGCVFSEMLTVRQHRSLQEYRDARFLPHVDNGYAFRTNLEVVNTWLLDLPDNVGPPEVRSLLLEQTMITRKDQKHAW
ncbi:Cell division protein kinase 2 CRK1 [Fonsecaea pedrosoi]|nr:Cell division protein kinase 2 CRK1 [Fonsecaea pedrosoi]